MIRLPAILGVALMLLTVGRAEPALADENGLISTYGISDSVADQAFNPQSEERSSPKSGDQSRVADAIWDASQQTGIDYEYLLAKAQLESGLNPRAKAPTSSASGLFQFIDSTWLSAWKRHGENLGLNARLSPSATTLQASWTDNLSAPSRDTVLGLRNDPYIAALLAGASAQDNAERLKKRLGREATYTELYLSHFLGTGGAARFLRLMTTMPDATAAQYFPAAARSNRSIFYFRSGEAKSFRLIMQGFDQKMAEAIALTSPLHRGTPSVGLKQHFSHSFEWSISDTSGALSQKFTEIRAGNPDTGSATGTADPAEATRKIGVSGSIPDKIAKNDINSHIFEYFIADTSELTREAGGFGSLPAPLPQRSARVVPTTSPAKALPIGREELAETSATPVSDGAKTAKVADSWPAKADTKAINAPIIRTFSAN